MAENEGMTRMMLGRFKSYVPVTLSDVEQHGVAVSAAEASEHDLQEYEVEPYLSAGEGCEAEEDAKGAKNAEIEFDAVESLFISKFVDADCSPAEELEKEILLEEIFAGGDVEGYDNMPEPEHWLSANTTEVAVADAECEAADIYVPAADAGDDDSIAGVGEEVAQHKHPQELGLEDWEKSSECLLSEYSFWPPAPVSTCEIDGGGSAGPESNVSGVTYQGGDRCQPLPDKGRAVGKDSGNAAQSSLHSKYLDMFHEMQRTKRDAEKVRKHELKKLNSETPQPLPCQDACGKQRTPGKIRRLMSNRNSGRAKRVGEQEYIKNVTDFLQKLEAVVMSYQKKFSESEAEAARRQSRT
mmetsp:Transcript_9388/g.28303  ORF Transcript_9388/g.28303 Transcript_9388/m.28303 type:complete len:355 (+) Transcript_9388:186-1250(+)